MFSIIVPIYNTDKYLKACIESILNQTYSDFELILVDDGSTDGCPAICDFYAQNDQRVTVIHKENGGQSSARKIGIQLAQRPYICYVDSDDLVEETWLEIMKQYIETANSPDILVFNIIMCLSPEKQQKIPCRIQSGYYNKERLAREIYPCMLIDRTIQYFQPGLYPVPWNKIYKSTLLKEHYCKDDRIGFMEDVAFVYECLYYADTVYFCEEALYYYTHYNENSASIRYYENYMERVTLVCDYLKQHLGGKNPLLDEQINAFMAKVIIGGSVAEVSHWPQKKQAIFHIRKKIAGSRLLKECRLSGLPHLEAKIFLLALKLRCVHLCYFFIKAKTFLINRRNSSVL